MLNFAGFSQDTVIAEKTIDEPRPTVQNDIRWDTERPQTLSKTGSFTLPKEKNPKVATWLSVAIPGAGQIYNGQWYKAAVIYGGIGALYYFYGLNVNERDIFQKEYRGRLNHSDTTFIPDRRLTNFSDEQVLYARDYYRRNVELVYVFSGLLYILNIIDACVFAHLSAFDVSENLSMRVQPYASPDLTPYAFNSQRLPMQGGIRLTFTLK